jgi:tetraacyldisaccharide 4'-kinase
MIRTPTFWQHRRKLDAWLLPLAWLYGLGAMLDRARAHPRKAPLPVIAIGNVTAGGSGKTPTTIALAAMLRDMGEVPHIISRGYGGTLRGPHRVTQSDTAAEVGDEALLLARHAPTWIGAKRIDSARAAHEAGATVILADDAMQHHALYKDATLCVVDATLGFGNERLLPAGPLREKLSPALARCNAAILIGSGAAPAALANLPCQRASLQPAGDVSFLRNQRWLAFSGIAYPQKFFATLEASGAILAHRQPFSDHHPFTTREISLLKQQAQTHGLGLITTEKDWVRIPPALREAIHAMPVALHWADAPAVKSLLIQLLAKARA